MIIDLTNAQPILLFTVLFVCILLLDSVDTRSALEQMREMITNTNRYVKEKQTKRLQADYILIRNIADYLTTMLKVQLS